MSSLALWPWVDPWKAVAEDQYPIVNVLSDILLIFPFLETKICDICVILMSHHWLLITANRTGYLKGNKK